MCRHHGEVIVRTSWHPRFPVSPGRKCVASVFSLETDTNRVVAYGHGRLLRDTAASGSCGGDEADDVPSRTI